MTPFEKLLQIGKQAAELYESGRAPEAVELLKRAVDSSEEYADLRPLLQKMAVNVLNSTPHRAPAVDMADPSTLRALLGRDASVLINIGSHYGDEARIFLETFPAAKAHCFDPDPRVVNNFRLHNHPRCHFYPLAVGDSNGEVPWYSSGGNAPDTSDGKGDWDLSSSLRAPALSKEVWPWISFTQSGTVPCVTLDVWAERYLPGDTPVDLIWADVQGAEAALVAGAPRTLARARFLYTEYYDVEVYQGQPTLNQLLALLPNFTVEGEDGWNILLRNKLL